jgi:hypothetical protein
MGDAPQRPTPYSSIVSTKSLGMRGHEHTKTQPPRNRQRGLNLKITLKLLI